MPTTVQQHIQKKYIQITLTLPLPFPLLYEATMASILVFGNEWVIYIKNLAYPTRGPHMQLGHSSMFSFS